VHGQAPDANVTYVRAASCNDSDLLAALALIVDNHLASIVSDSWGEPLDQATLIATFDQVFQAGAAEGIGFFFSSGDSGYEDPAEDPGSDTLQVDYPTSSPYVTSVGGTSLAIGSSNNYEFETSWGTLIDPLAANGRSWQSSRPAPTRTATTAPAAAAGACCTPSRPTRRAWCRTAWPPRCRAAPPPPGRCAWCRTWRSWPTRAPGS
jgi:hypothetical protein